MSSAEKYVHSLKKIKEAEEQTEQEIEIQKKKMTDDIRNYEAEISKSIADAKIEGERLVETTVEKSKMKANAETERIVEEAKEKSKNNASRIDSGNVKEIIDILLQEV